MASDIIRTLSGTRNEGVWCLRARRFPSRLHLTRVRIARRGARRSQIDLYFSTPARVCVCDSTLQISEFTHRVGAEALQLLR